MIPTNYFQNIKDDHLNQIIEIEYDSYNNPWTKEHFKNDINHKCSMNYLYKKNNKLLAYLFGYLVGDEYHLNKITVKQKYRQKNIGKLLFLHCLDKLLKKNVKSIQLEVSSLNLIAQKFYENLNFKYVGIRNNYYAKNDHGLLYTLELK